MLLASHTLLLLNSIFANYQIDPYPRIPVSAPNLLHIFVGACLWKGKGYAAE